MFLQAAEVMSIKPTVGRAKRMVMASRLPFDVLIARQRERIQKLDDRIGALMNKRVEEEEVLSDLYKLVPKVVE